MLALLALAPLALSPSAAAARPFRVALQTDAVTLDPDALNAGSTSLIVRQIYESLVGRGEDYKKAPALAVAWVQRAPLIWRFSLRPGVVFQDGSAFDADDVVFSLRRAQSGFSDFKLYTAGITEVRKIDPLTVDIITAEPDPILPDKLSRVFIMDRTWAEAHGVADPPQPSSPGSSFAAVHANGTGPYMLVRRDPDGETDLERNPHWWGRSDLSVGRAAFVPIASDAARVAALLADDVDMIVDVPPQMVPRISADKGAKLVEGPENRTIFLGMDVARDSLIHGSVKNRNPFKDRKVREALSLAIDADAIKRGLMQGHSVPAGLLWAPSVFGYSAQDDKRAAPDVSRAKQMLAEAGYPSGFSVTLDCPSDRYVNDVGICQAVAAQLARIDVQVRVNVLPFPLWVSKLRRLDTSFYLIGWASPTFDALFTLQAILHSRGQGADGSNNFGGYSNPKVDSLIDRIKSESDPGRRLALIREAGRIAKNDVAYLPIHHQTIIWAMRRGVDAVLPPENQLELTWVRSSERFN